MNNLSNGLSKHTPMGGNLQSGGATFRTWAPNAQDVYVVTDPVSTNNWQQWTPIAKNRLQPMGDGTWGGFVPDLTDGSPYLFWIRGPKGGTEGFKRDPYARELGASPSFPNCPCLLRNPDSYPWRTQGWKTPLFHEFIIYQLHIGAFWSVDKNGVDRRQSYGRFLDCIEKLPYLKDLGVNALQFLPIQEYDNDFGLGYSNLDYFSPESTYQVHQKSELEHYLANINKMLQQNKLALLSLEDLSPGPNQLKCLVDLCHLHGLAVIFDVVYNHAGGGFSDRDLYYYDQQSRGNDNLSLYFTDKGWAGGKVFAYWNDNVRQFLIDNAAFFLKEYRIDGFRYDEVSVTHDHGGDAFSQDLTSTLRYLEPQAIQIAEYWNWDRARPVIRREWGGLGFDAALNDGLRGALRQVVEQASQGREGSVAMDAVRHSLYRLPGYDASWRAVNHLENHDMVLWRYGEHRSNSPRVPKLADYNNARSWYARSRTRVVTTLLLTAPGIPMLFMGQEFLEEKPWSDDVKNWHQFLIWWDGLKQDRHMQDFHFFMRDLLWLRRNHAALHSEGICVSQTHEQDRILVMHRWVEGVGDDCVVIVSLSEENKWDYSVQLPWPGRWREIFNSDYYDHHPNPQVFGNGGPVYANSSGGNCYPYSARVSIPANGAIILARD